jgi:L-fucose mutarotase/ribose pyranase (RbsD/FucU family)
VVKEKVRELWVRLAAAKATEPILPCDAVLAEAGSSLQIEPILKWDFYQHVESPDHVLTIQTADQSLWANVLLTMGCRTV